MTFGHFSDARLPGHEFPVETKTYWENRLIGMTPIVSLEVDLPTQQQQTMQHLRTHSNKGLSPLEAFGLYRIMRLADVIFKLKNKGFRFRRELKQDATGKRYARYFLAE